MGAIKKPKDVCLIAALCYNKPELKEASLKILQKKYGAVEYITAPVLFSHTAYYAEEMGASLEKIYFSFEKLVDPEQLPDIKLFANSIEEKFSTKGKRNVNIDPGYIETPKLVLATTKNFSHRIYLGKGIYGDVQLFWRNGRFNANPWTYPDYKETDTRLFFEKVRNAYFQRIKGLV